MLTDLPSLGTILLWALITLVLSQVIVVVVLVAFGRRRKRRVAEHDRAERDEHVHGELEVVGNRLRVYTDGRPLYRDMLRDIEGAQRHVLFETYIWKDDEVGRAFKEALTAKAKDGVEVYVIYDTLANLVVPRSFFRFAPELRVLPYRAWRKPANVVLPSRWGRDHRKLLIVDEHVGYVGGFNIGQDYRDQWRDTHLRVEGPGACDLGFAFVDFWNARSDASQPALSQVRRPWSPRLRVHRNDRGRLLFPIRSIYLEAIEHAQHRIRMTHAYFVPDPAVTAALLRAAGRGVDVRILVPWQSNHVVVDWLSRHLYERFLGGGVRLYLYDGAMIHAKTTTIDGEWTTIGTANMDRLSLAGNHEINVEIFDTEVAAMMEEIFEGDIANAHEVSLAAWRKRPWYQQASEAILAPLWPLV